MSLVQINSALVTAYKAALPAMPTQFDLQPGFDPPDTGLYVQANFVIADDYAVTLGDDGQDEVIGYFQTAVWGDADKGIKQFLETLDTLKSYFKNGVSFLYQTQYVTVLRSRVTPIRSVNGRAVIVYQISWRARIERNA